MEVSTRGAWTLHKCTAEY